MIAFDSAKSPAGVEAAAKKAGLLVGISSGAALWGVRQLLARLAGPDLRAIRIEAGDVSTARNTGIETARGRFLAFLGLCYAGWFTGTTGQTPGKMLAQVKVVRTDGSDAGCAGISIASC